MNDILTMRTELANDLAVAGAKLLHFTATAGALAAIPDTEPPQYVVAGTLDSIQKVLPTAAQSNPGRRKEDSHPAEPLSWDDAASAAPDAGSAAPTGLSHRLRAQAVRPFGPEGFALLTEAADALDRAAQPVAVAGSVQTEPNIAEKALYWFNTLETCHRLLGCPEDSPIPYGVLHAVEAIARRAAQPSPVCAAQVASIDENALNDAAWEFSERAPQGSIPAILWNNLKLALRPAIELYLKRAAPSTGAEGAQQDQPVAAVINKGASYADATLTKFGLTLPDRAKLYAAPTERAAAPADVTALFKKTLGTLALKNSTEAEKIGAEYRELIATSLAAEGVRETLLFAAKVVELYDDATLSADDYMIDSRDCAAILTALADYMSKRATQQQGAQGVKA